jgi:choline-phosphate cytidylyltransferase
MDKINNTNKMKRVYIDGVFDLFHRGHLESLIKAKNCLNDPENTYLLVGVVGDEDATGYKRKPIVNEEDRREIISSIKYVDKVICPCPLVVDMNFIKENNIDLVVHGFVSEQDRNKQKDFYETITKEGYFKEIEYYSKISTSDIIKNIKQNY